MKCFFLIFALALGIQGAMPENDVSGYDCFVPAVCSKGGYSETAWMSIFRPVCEANIDIAMKGVQGEVGPKGERGPVGLKGDDGPQGEVGQPGSKGENGIKGGIGPKGEPSSVESLDIGNRIKALCPMIYDNKCFIPVAVGNTVNYDGGVSTCESLGAHIANIYSQTHMDDVMKYIRENRMGGSSQKDFRIGMKYDPKAKKLTLRDGTDAPAGLKWYPGRPLTVDVSGEGAANYTNVILEVRSDQSSTNQYLYNDTPSNEYYVLCEIE